MYRSSEEVLKGLESGKTTIQSVNRQMLRYFNKRNVEKWLMFAEAKVRYNMILDDIEKDNSNS